MDPLEVRRWLLYFYCIQGELTQGHKLLLRWRCGSGPEIPAGIWQVQTWPCSGAEPHLTPKAWPLLPWVLVGYSHSVCASKGWSLTIALNSVFLMDHHCLSFLLTHFGNWVLHLEEPSFLCVCLLLFVTSEVVPALLPDIQGFLPQGTAESQPCKIKWSKLVWGFPPPLWLSASTEELSLSSLIFTQWQPWWVYRIRRALSMCGDSMGMETGMLCSFDPESK